MGLKLIAVTVVIIAISLSYWSDIDEADRITGVPFDFKMSQNLSAFVLGATGEVGKAIINALAEAPQFSRVTLIGRRQVTLPTPDKDARFDKFDEKIIDFDKLEEHAEDFKGYDVGFSTLGTTRAKSGPSGFYKVDHDYVVNTAKLAKEGGCKHFHLISSSGANKDSFFLYTKTKGEAEAEVTLLDFQRLSIYRPALLLVPGREEVRVFESIARAIIKPLDIFRWLSVDVSLLGNVIVANSFRLSDLKVEILGNSQINALGKEVIAAVNNASNQN